MNRTEEYTKSVAPLLEQIKSSVETAKVEQEGFKNPEHLPLPGKDEVDITGSAEDAEI